MLLLFDIDMTLTSTGGAGMRAMKAAVSRAFGDKFVPGEVPFAGRLDPLILTDMLTSSGLVGSPEQLLEVRRSYARMLAELLAMGDCHALPGVPALVAHLVQEQRQMPHLTLGLLTGNYEETGRMKLRACRVDQTAFTVAAWGDESPHVPPKRADLVPIAMARDAALRGRTLPPHEVVIIGDTPHDVDCAKAHGCRVLGVATGHSSESELREHGADHTVPNLGDTQRVADWLLAR
ncbi:MAG: HAD hydrolase-like protein [Phycisphaerales bacterium]|jgi:phosphoglycolate phosphatase-like HAD superfamily hydrolase